MFWNFRKCGLPCPTIPLQKAWTVKNESIYNAKKIPKVLKLTNQGTNVWKMENAHYEEEISLQKGQKVKELRNFT